MHPLFEYWYTIDWAAENMDDITGIYGGHHYINNYDLFDNTFYSFFLNKMKWGVGLAESKNKRFISWRIRCQAEQQHY